jgi:hypothetical protein
MKKSFIIRTMLAGGVFCAVGLAQAQNNVTFSVDMTKLVQSSAIQNGVTPVSCAGSFNGWNTTATPLTNDPSILGNGSNVYSGTVNVADAVGTVEQYKFTYFDGVNTQWESPDSTCGNNREFTLASGGQTLPTVFWNDQPLVLPTNNVTFSVDMTAQIQITGAFTPGSSSVYCRGGFEGWGGGNFLLTNNPALSGNASNIYSGTWPLGAVAGACQSYKFYIDTGANWESPASTAGNNRTFQAAGVPATLPTVYFNDASLGDFLPVDTAVTFNVNMTNAVANDGTVFNPSVDTVYINGDFLGWWAWGPFPPAQYQMTNNPPGSLVYSLTIVRPKGSGLTYTYKYTIDGNDNENGFAINHFRYVRQTPVYGTPLDIFGTNVVAGQTGPISEPYPGFGSLSAGTLSGGNVPVSWLGRPGVHLQSKSSLSAGPWTELLGTDGTNWTSGHYTPYGFVSVTNYPAAAGTKTFFRLVKP